jgi:hypothetical protein
MGHLSSLQLLIITILYLVFLIYILSRIFKNEKGFRLIVAIVFVMSVPFLGVLSYLIYDKFYLKNKQSK